jgi:hypothetical protein
MKLKFALLALVAAAGLVTSVALADPGHGKGKGKSDDEAAAADTSSSTSTTTTTEEPGKGKGKSKGQAKKAERAALGCKPSVAVNLKGTLASVDGTTIVVNVVHANRHGRSYVGLQVPVGTTEFTKFRKAGPSTLAELVVGDLVKVHARTCKPKPGDEPEEAVTPPAAEPVAPALVARMVIAKLPAADDEDEDGTTTTSTETTTTTSTEVTTTTSTEGTTTTSS